MNQLDPELRRLIRWCGDPEPGWPGHTAPGFTARVIARWRSDRAPAEPRWWLRVEQATVWACGILLVLGIGFWASQRPDPNLAQGLVPAYQLAARQLAP